MLHDALHRAGGEKTSRGETMPCARRIEKGG
jgi:hypothetical protein